MCHAPGPVSRAGTTAHSYVIENDQILFSSQHGLHAGEIKQFALQALSSAARAHAAVATGPAAA